MKIPTANVIVGLNREVMDRLFSEGSTYTSLIAGLQEEDGALLFDNQANPNFISFEHSLNFGGGSKMTLVLLDPKGELESRLLTDSPLAQIAGSLRTHKGDTKESNKDLERSNEKFDDKYFSELAQEYAEHLGDKEFYIAYGSGENLELWAGPHRVILQSSDISMKGAKKITLEFQATAQPLDIRQRKGAYNENINLNLAGMSMRYSGHSKPIFIPPPDPETTEYNGKSYIDIKQSQALRKHEKRNLSPYNPLDYLDLGASFTKEVKKNIRQDRRVLEDLDYDNLASKISDFDFHSIIVDTIRNYVQKATNNPNVIVLLPNLNISCRKYISQLLSNNEAAATLLEVGVEFVIRQPTNIRRKELFIRNLLSSFGMDLVSVNKQDIASSLVKVVPNAAINKYLSVEKARSSKEREEFYYEDTLFYCKLQKASDFGVPDHISVLKEVMDKIIKHSKDSAPIYPIYVNETSTKLLNFWSKGTGTVEPFKFPLFGGYTDFNETQEAVIVGDKSLVADYLYGDSYLSKSYETIKEAKKQLRRNKKLEDTERQSDEFYLGNEDRLEQINEKRDGLLTTMLEQIPLHPLDKSIVGSVNYNKQVRSILYPKRKSNTGAFGDTSYLPDTFAHKDTSFTKEEKDLIEEHSIPIFRFNTENPNVLDMNFKFGAYYFAALTAGFKKKITRKASLVSSGILPPGIGSLPVRTKAAAVAFQKVRNHALGLGDQERQEFIAKLARKNSEDLEAVDVDPEEATILIASFLDKLAKDPLLGFVEIEQQLDGTPHGILTGFMEEMYRNGLRMDIKTLPFFHLSNLSTISKGSCLLFAQDTPILQSRQVQRSLINNFYSGYYGIVGFKHTISSGASESEFKLVKHTKKARNA
tara:strand:+ start:3348 stop:5963 length:2616 start_codon:yes stop_codon:yes gene_type:complete